MLLPGQERLADGVQETAILLSGTASCVQPAGSFVTWSCWSSCSGVFAGCVLRGRLLLSNAKYPDGVPLPRFFCTGFRRSQSEFFSEMPAPLTTERDTPGVSASCSGRKYSVPVDPIRLLTRFGSFSPGRSIVI